MQAGTRNWRFILCGMWRAPGSYDACSRSKAWSSTSRSGGLDRHGDGSWTGPVRREFALHSRTITRSGVYPAASHLSGSVCEKGLADTLLTRSNVVALVAGGPQRQRRRPRARPLRTSVSDVTFLEGTRLVEVIPAHVGVRLASLSSPDRFGRSNARGHSGDNDNWFRKDDFSTHVSEADDGSIRVMLAGEFDLSTAADLRACLVRPDVLGAKRMQVDLRRVTFLDSSSIGVLVGPAST